MQDASASATPTQSGPDSKLFLLVIGHGIFQSFIIHINPFFRWGISTRRRIPSRGVVDQSQSSAGYHQQYPLACGRLLLVIGLFNCVWWRHTHSAWSNGLEVAPHYAYFYAVSTLLRISSFLINVLNEKQLRVHKKPSWATHLCPDRASEDLGSLHLEPPIYFQPFANNCGIQTWSQNQRICKLLLKQSPSNVLCFPTPLNNSYGSGLDSGHSTTFMTLWTFWTCNF